ncbi:MAG TPA: sensor histidine kinase [Clostridiaceae bacterium]|nr:sensor histidine kinase [Clostridiaceae bacterium]
MKSVKYKNYFFTLINNISFKSRVFIFCAGILMVYFSLFAFLTISISNRAIVDKAVKNAARELAIIEKSLLNLTSNVENYVRILTMDIRLQNQLERIKNNDDIDLIGNIEVEKILSTTISNVVQPVTYIAAASIISSKGNLANVGYVDNSSVSSVFDDDLQRYITDNKSPVWTGLLKIRLKSNAGYENVFAIAKTIIGFDTGHILGTAVLYLREKDVATIYLDNMVNKNDKFYIIDEHKNIISTQDKSELYEKFDEDKYLGTHRLEDFPDGQSIIRNIGGKQLLVTVMDFEKLNWKIISIIPIQEIASENKGITRLILIFGVICLFFAFALSYLFSYTISKPILKLVGTMKKIRSGNLQLRANFDAGGEIGMLRDGFNSLMDKINNLLEQICIEQKIKRENEFRLLQSQVKPHFLYNTIETIISFIKLNLKDNAMMTAKNLANFYRISLSKGNDLITIKEEIQLIESYLSIQKLRYIEYLDYSIEFDEEVLKYQIPKLTLQPLVENSIYHGLKEKDDKGLLTIKAFLEQDTVKIEVLDDGVGMTEEQITRVLKRTSNDKKSNDFGLYSVDKRLKLLYGEQYGLSIESKVTEYTKVTINLPAIIA